MKKICIVSTRHISYNPRVLKEADALDAAGFGVVVVTIRNDERQAAFDDELMRGRKWKLRTVNFRRGRRGEVDRRGEGSQKGERGEVDRRGEGRYWLYLTLKQRFFLLLSKISLRWGIAERASEKAFDGLLRLAAAERADLYIAHHAEALGAAWVAAKRNKARFGFDAEDFHTGMEDTSARTNRVIAYLEGRYLPLCEYLTAASKGIAEAYRDKYGIKLPQVILNVFPLEDLPVRPPGSPVRFYWYSQVIGPNRGIELLLDAASRVGGRGFEIHLRGQLYSEDYVTALRQRYGGSRLWDRVFMHEPIAPASLIEDANQFDIGLALESDVSVNRNICVTNKVFSYLMSRLFIIGTDTYGQKDIFTHFPGAVRICRMDDPEDLADAMRAAIAGELSVMDGKRSAGEAAAETFNWEQESKKLQTYTESILKS